MMRALLTVCLCFCGIAGCQKTPPPSAPAPNPPASGPKVNVDVPGVKVHVGDKNVEVNVPK